MERETLNVTIDVKPWPAERGERCAAYRKECRGACGKGDEAQTIPIEVVWFYGADPTQEELEEEANMVAVQYQDHEVQAVEGKGKDKGKNVDGKGRELFAGILQPNGNYWQGEDATAAARARAISLSVSEQGLGNKGKGTTIAAQGKGHVAPIPAWNAPEGKGHVGPIPAWAEFTTAPVVVPYLQPKELLQRRKILEILQKRQDLRDLRDQEEQDKKLAREERFGTGAPAPTKTATKKKKKLVAAPWACHLVLAEKKVLRDQEEQEELAQGIAEGEIALAQARKNLRDFNQANPTLNLREAARTHAKNLREAAIVLQIDVIADKKRQFAELHERNRAAWGVPGNNAGPQDLDEEGASCFT
jgi:hypothetical protein